MTLAELIERIVKLDGPDRQLDGLIYRVVHDVADWRRGPTVLGHIEGLHGEIIDVPHYTSSFDAAVKLVPDGHDWIVASVNGQVGGTPYACVGSTKEHFSGTPVTSLVLASLRARASALSGNARATREVE